MASRPRWREAPSDAPRGMNWIPGGRFVMGSDQHYPEERPARQAFAEGFWIDRTPVTNRKFARFVEATGYVTVAEAPPRAEDYPGAPPENLRAGSMLFVPPKRIVPLTGPPLWWDYVHGADWRHPAGPGSSLDGREDHPVIHVALADIEAYAAWAGAAIPTEAEWEYAARGGLADSEFAWGDEFMPEGRFMANTWQGLFPYHDNAEDGWAGTSPVGSFPANGYGLFDMIGNVWEWTCDWWSTTGGGAKTAQCCAAEKASVAEGDPQRIPRKVLKGGSHLCALNFCRRYRPPARHAHPVDTSTSHIGFRCVIRPKG